MLLGIASFGFAAISVFVAIFTFMFGDKIDKRLRYPLSAAFLLLTLLCSLVGLFSFANIRESTTQSPTQEVIFVTPTVPFELTATTPVPPTNTPETPQIQPSSTRHINCAIATPLPHRVPVVGEPWILPSGGWIHLNFWSNEPGIDQTEHKILLGPDDPRVFLGGGSAWQFPDECEGAARANFRPVPLPEISLEELRSQNLVVR